MSEIKKNNHFFNFIEKKKILQIIYKTYMAGFFFFFYNYKTAGWITIKVIFIYKIFFSTKLSTCYKNIFSVKLYFLSYKKISFVTKFGFTCFNSNFFSSKTWFSLLWNLLQNCLNECDPCRWLKIENRFLLKCIIFYIVIIFKTPNIEIFNMHTFKYVHIAIILFSIHNVNLLQSRYYRWQQKANFTSSILLKYCHFTIV